MLGTCNYVLVLISPYWTKPLDICKIRENFANYLIPSIEEVKFSPLFLTYQFALLMRIKHQDLNQWRLLTTLGRDFSVGFNVRHFHEKQTNTLDLVTKMWYVSHVASLNCCLEHENPYQTTSFRSRLVWFFIFNLYRTHVWHLQSCFSLNSAKFN